MYPELETGYFIQDSEGLESAVVHYLSDMVSCFDKLRFWKEVDFKRELAVRCGVKPEDIGMVKTILFSYFSEGQEKYMLVSTTAEKQVHHDELRVELGLSGEEAQTLTHKISEAVIKDLSGAKRGAVSPLLEPEYLHKVEVVYFTRDLMEEATAFPEKRYDVPKRPCVSEFWNAAVLFDALQQKSPKYKAAGDFETEMAVSELKVKKIDPKKAGYGFLFNGTVISYRGQEYRITNPPLKKEGADRKRKQILCTAFPLTRSDGKFLYEYVGRGKKRVLLPITYERLEKQVQMK